MFLRFRGLKWPIVGTHPSGLVENEADEERRQFVASDLQCACARHGHEALCACLAHAPDAVLTQVVKLRQLQQSIGLVNEFSTQDDHRKDTKLTGGRLCAHDRPSTVINIDHCTMVHEEIPN